MDLAIDLGCIIPFPWTLESPSFNLDLQCMKKLKRRNPLKSHEKSVKIRRKEFINKDVFDCRKVARFPEGLLALQKDSKADCCRKTLESCPDLCVQF